MNLKAKTVLYLTFTKSTLLISIACAIPLTFIGLSNGNVDMLESIPILQMISYFLRTFCLAGLPISILYKELSKKNEYYFYYNTGISKVGLIIATSILYILSSILIYLICHMISNII